MCSPVVSHGIHDSMPSNTRPSARRSHCSRPHGSARDERRGRARTSSVGQQLAAREDLDLGEVGRRALVVHAELGEAVDLVAPQVDAHRHVGGRREHVDDRAAERRPRRGARPGTRGDSRASTSSATSSAGSTCCPVVIVDRLDVLDVRAEPLHERPHAARRRTGARARACAAATSPAAVGPSSRRQGSPARTATSPTPGTARPRPRAGTRAGRWRRARPTCSSGAAPGTSAGSTAPRGRRA